MSDATCEKNETGKYKATFTNSAFVEQESEVFEVLNTKSNHKYSNSDYKCDTCDSDIFNLNGNYGYNWLKDNFENNAIQKLYEDIYNSCKEFFCSNENKLNNIIMEIKLNEYGLSIEEALTVYSLLYRDCPLFYWLDGITVIDESTIGLVVSNTYLNSVVRTECNMIILGAINEVSNMKVKHQSDYETSIFLHDYIIDCFDYKFDENGQPSEESEAHNIIGAFSKRGGVCEAYAKSFQLLLNYFEIENILVGGEAGGEDHVWNLVNLEGTWFYYDLTWDDNNKWEDGWGKYYFDYNYYWTAKSKSFFESTHFIKSDSTVLGINYQYSLSQISESDYVSQNSLIGQEFEIDGIRYVIISSYKVEIKYIDKEGEVIIPEKIDYNGTEYICSSIGTGQKGIFSSSLATKITSIYIPKTIEFIWPCSLTRNIHSTDIKQYTLLENIYVDDENQFYASLDGVLYTKSMKTLVAYPAGNARTNYTIPDSVEQIANNAFAYNNYLQELTIGKNIQMIGKKYQNVKGKMHWDIVPNMNEIIVHDDLKFIVELMSNNSKMLIDSENQSFYSDDTAIYSLNYRYPAGQGPVATLLYVYPADTFTIKQSIETKGKLWDLWQLHIDGYGKYYYTSIFNAVNSIIIENKYFTLKDGVLYYKDIYNRFDPIVIIEQKAKVEIAEGASTTNNLFANNSVLEEIVLPSSIKELEHDFSFLINLKQVKLTKSITKIKAYTFYGCEKLTDIYYDGTIEQWNSIVFESNWTYNSGDFVIHCLDGDI